MMTIEVEYQEGAYVYLLHPQTWYSLMVYVGQDDVLRDKGPSSHAAMFRIMSLSELIVP